MSKLFNIVNAQRDMSVSKNFFYMLFDLGIIDFHSALSVSNKWIHERGQEFRRPCGLTEVD